MKDLQLGRVTVHARTNVADPTTETARKVERVSMTTPEMWTEYKNAGGCGKPASGYSLYCDNHEPMHHSDDTTKPVTQFIDNRPQGRQRVILCAHRTAPKPTSNAPQIPAITQTTTARTEKENTMTTANTLDISAIMAQVSALNAALAAMTAAPTAQANVPTAQANVPTAQANVPTAQANVPAPEFKNAPLYDLVPNVPTVVTIAGFIDVTFGLKTTVFKTGNVGYTGNTKGTCRYNGKDYQVSLNISEIHRKEKEEDTKK